MGANRLISFTAVLTAAVLPSPILANRLSSTLYLSEVPDRLSEPERVIYDSLQVETLAYCEGRRDCLDQRPYQILDLLNARRQLLLFYGDQGIQERLAARCEGRQGTVRTVGTGPWTQCLREIGRLSSREGMALIGEHRLGVTRAGFDRLRYGMPIGGCYLHSRRPLRYHGRCSRPRHHWRELSLERQGRGDNHRHIPQSRGCFDGAAQSPLIQTP